MIVSRIAPTPSGLLHPGNGMNFILCWVLTRAQNGKLWLRIDDLDQARYRDEYLDDIFETIDWLGIDYDGGPRGYTDFKIRWSQLHRLDRYREAIEQLKAQGTLFACDCSRKAIRARSTDGFYPGICVERGLPFLEDNAWRVHARAGARAKEGDSQARTSRSHPPYAHTITPEYCPSVDAFVVKQKNNFPAYQIASLVDDVDWGVNYIVRGEDLWSSTYSQYYLAQLLEWKAFTQTQFFHHPLLVDKQGQKLSKSQGAGSLRAWRDAGRSPADLYQQAAQLLGLVGEYPDEVSLLAAVRSRMDRQG